MDRHAIEIWPDLGDLRHVHATLLLRAGVPVHVVAARLGHADPAVTLRVYAHVLRDQASAVAQVFASALEDEGTDDAKCWQPRQQAGVCRVSRPSPPVGPQPR